MRSVCIAGLCANETKSNMVYWDGRSRHAVRGNNNEQIRLNEMKLIKQMKHSMLHDVHFRRNLLLNPSQSNNQVEAMRTYQSEHGRSSLLKNVDK